MFVSQLYDSISENPKKTLVAFTFTSVGIFALTRFKVAMPSQFLALTGPGISTVKVGKKAVQWPFQTVTVMDMTPQTYELHISAMSKDKQDMGLPITFSIGPGTDEESQIKYATLLSGCPDVRKVVMGFIEPEARSIAANLGIEDMFQHRQAYRDKVQESVKEDLGALGMVVWQSGIKEIEDDKTRKDGTKYFHFLRLIKSSEAEQTARQAVAELQFKGDVTVKEKERDTRMQSATFEANAVKVESESRIEVARYTAALKVEEAKFLQQSQIARIESEKAAALREADLQREVEQKNITRETEHLRSVIMSKTTVEAESLERMAHAKLIAAQKEAEALFAKAKAQADGNLALATADATGILKKFEAQAEGMQLLQQSLGSADNLLSHEMIQQGTYTDIAKANAEALRDMKPTIWSTGGGGGSGDSTVDIAQKLVGLLSIVSDQTGIKPPAWMAQMPNQSSSGQNVKKWVKKD